MGTQAKRTPRLSWRQKIATNRAPTATNAELARRPPRRRSDSLAEAPARLRGARFRRAASRSREEAAPVTARAKQDERDC